MPCVSSQGYQGMVDGGANIEEATWESVSNMLQVVSLKYKPLSRCCSMNNATSNHAVIILTLCQVSEYFSAVRAF